MQIPPTIKVILEDLTIDWEDNGLEAITENTEKYLLGLESVVYEFIRDALNSKGIPSSSYSLGDDGDFGRLSIKRIGYFWMVYASERGKKTAPSIFRDYDDAIAFFISKLDRSLIDWSKLSGMVKQYRNNQSHLL